MPAALASYMPSSFWVVLDVEIAKKAPLDALFKPLKLSHSKYKAGPSSKQLRRLYIQLP